MISSVNYGSAIIHFSITYSNRKTLGITVQPNAEVIVNAPMETSLEKINEKILKRAPWILKQQRFFRSFYPKSVEKRFVSGETHLYLGRQYRLNIKEAQKENSVKIQGGYIEVCAQNKEKAKDLILSWYKEKAKEKLQKIALPLIEKFIQKHALSDIDYCLQIKYMPTRWGSCTAKGKIILNPELVKAPKPCIEYVIMHELCHLIHHNHTQKFLDLQESEMNDWAKWKNKLEQVMI